MNNRLSRRNFAKMSLTGAAALVTIKQTWNDLPPLPASNCIRLGGPVSGDFKDPQDWIKAVKAKGYSAAYCPVAVGTDSGTIKAFEKAARDADIIISEVGAWSNPVSRNEKERNDAIKKCKDSLALADLIGAGCCVNITGSRGEKWDGPDPENMSRGYFRPDRSGYKGNNRCRETSAYLLYSGNNALGSPRFTRIHTLNLLKPLTGNNLPFILIP